MYLVRVFTLATYGIDFSDEGRHLNEIKYASSYSWSASQYGSLIHPIAEFFDYNILYLRIFNLALTFFLSFWVFQIQFSKSKSLDSQGKYFSLLCSAVFGLMGLTFFNVWLPTPSYYSLTFQSLMLYWISFKLLNLENVSTLNLLSIIFLSFTSSIVFLSKPTTFFVVWAIAMVSIWLYTAKKAKYSIYYNLFLLLFLFISSQIYFGNPISLFNRILAASHFMGIQDPAYRLENVFRLDSFPFPWDLLALIYLFTALLGGIVVLRFKPWFYLKTIIYIFLIFSFFMVTYLFVSNFNFDSNPIILLVAPFFFAINIILLSSGPIFPPREFVINSFLMLIPLAYALGGNGNLWTTSTQAIFFFVVFAWWLITKIKLSNVVRQSQFLILALSTTLSICTIEYGLSHPYRQIESLSLQKITASFDDSLNGVKLSNQIKSSFDQVYKSADKARLPRGLSIIDLTGQSPLTLFALNAYPVGNPWMVGGYAGSNSLAIEVLEDVGCKTLNESWLLIEPNGPRSLDVNAVLGAFGLNLQNYSFAASWYTPIGAGGYIESRLQKLYKPLARDPNIQEKECQLIQAR
jgi:hypothetical protein